MSRVPVFPVEDKVRIVLSILAGEVTVAEAARRAKVSEQSVGTWKRQFLIINPTAPMMPAAADSSGQPIAARSRHTASGRRAE